MSSTADRLRTAADLAETNWDPDNRYIINALEEAAGDGPDADDISLDLWDAVVTHLGERLIGPWERKPGRTRAQVAAMLRAAADAQPA